MVSLPLNVLWRHFMVYKSTDHRKLPSIYLSKALFSVEKARALHLTSFSLSVLRANEHAGILTVIVKVKFARSFSG